MWWWWWWGEDTWLHGHVRCAQVCVMMFEGKGVMCTYKDVSVCVGGGRRGGEGVIPVNVRCEFVIVLILWVEGWMGIYGNGWVYMGCV